MLHHRSAAESPRTILLYDIAYLLLDHGTGKKQTRIALRLRAFEVCPTTDTSAISRREPRGEPSYDSVPDLLLGQRLPIRACDAVAGRKAVMKATAKRRRVQFDIGWREWVMLPDLGMMPFKAKIDTGARSAALHAINIETFDQDNRHWVRFRVPGDHHGNAASYVCTAPLQDVRDIRNTSGVPAPRFVIRTHLVLGRFQWPIEVTLADREEMGFSMILGRASLRRHRIVIHPDRSFLQGMPTQLPAK